MILNHAAAGFGNYAIAALTIALRISYIAYALVIGFGQGFQPICAINYGAKQYGRIKTAFRYALITVSVFLVVSVLGLVFGAERLTAHFTGDAEAAGLAIQLIRSQQRW